MISTSQNIGDFYQGGIVFYNDSFGNGLIIDTSYIQATYPWSTQSDLVSDWGPNLHYCAGTEDTSHRRRMDKLLLISLTIILISIMQQIFVTTQLQEDILIGFYLPKRSYGRQCLK